MSEPYVYPGFSKFAAAAAEEHGAEGAIRGKIRMGWHVKTIASSLARLPEQAKTHPDSVPAVVARIREIRDGLAAQLTAVDLAIEEVFGAVAPPRTLLLKDEKQPKPKRNRRPRARPEPAPPAEEEAPEEAESEAQEQEEEASEDDQDPEDEREDAESAD